MSDSSMTPEEWAHQTKKHLQSLQEAGVEWLPLGEPPQMTSDFPPSPSNSEETPKEGDSDPFSPKGEGDLFAEPVPQLSVEQRRTSLDLLIEQISTCSRCAELASTRTQTVFGEGPLDPELCFIGEAPGFNEDKQGRPFVGEAGQLLDRIIKACGFKREEVYIANILKCRPPGNRTPLVTEADNCREYLDQQLELIRPRYICAMGACAAQNLLGTTQSIGKMRKRFFDYNGIPVICTYHPAYLLRNADAKRLVWEDLKMLLKRMGREVPSK